MAIGCYSLSFTTRYSVALIEVPWSSALHLISSKDQFLTIKSQNYVRLHITYLERELLGDRVMCLVWQAYLRMAKLPFTNEVAPNADYMSPTGTCKSNTIRLTEVVKKS